MSVTIRKATPLVAALSLLFPLAVTSQEIVAAATTGLISVCLTGVILVLACQIAISSDVETIEKLEDRLLFAGLLTLLVVCLSHVTVNLNYGTDEAAFTQRAAQLLVHGHNPYGTNLTSSLIDFGVPKGSWTYFTNGSYLQTYPYPALSILLSAPIVLADGHSQAPVIVDSLAVMLEAALLWRILPKSSRAVSLLLCVALPTLSNLAADGLTGVIVTPCMTVVAYRWRDIGASGRMRRSDSLRAAALGLAASANQLAWFVAPFVILGIYLIKVRGDSPKRSLVIASQFTIVVLATFLLVNIPFVFWNPHTWLEGILKPFTIHAIPDGIGPVFVTEFMHLGGGAVGLFAILGAVVFLALLLSLCANFDRLAPWCFVLPVTALWFTERPMPEYWELLAPAVVVSAICGGSHPALRTRGKWKAPLRYASVILTAASVALIVKILTTPSPLKLTLVTMRSDPRTHTITNLIVSVHNRSGSALGLRFQTTMTNQASPFWRIIAGASALGPGKTGLYRLEPSRSVGGPADGSVVALEAITSTPATLSESTEFVAH